MSTTKTGSACIHGQGYRACPLSTCPNYWGAWPGFSTAATTKKPILTPWQKTRLLALLEDQLIIKTNHYIALGFGSEEAKRLMDEIADLVDIKRIIKDNL